MRQSYYNVLAPLEGGAALYNVAHQTMALLDGEDLEKLRRIEDCGDAAFVEELAANRLLVEDPEAEADLLAYHHNCYRYDTRVLDLTIMPTRLCNCECDYCYVAKKNSFMSSEVQDLVCEFIAAKYDECAFKKLRITWYGGEPLLGIDVMEALSARMMAFCEKRGVSYHGHILTNATLADEEMCRRLVENCGMVSIMPTISGNGVMHEWQRPLKSGEHYFDRFKANIRHMADAGMLVRANFVVNHNNYEECKALVEELCDHPNIVSRLTRTFAYGRPGFKLKDPNATPIELFSREEFGPYYVDFFRAQHLSAAEYEHMLKPQCLYCAAWVDRQFYIDEAGAVYGCMIDMDIPEDTLFTLQEWKASGGCVGDAVADGRGYCGQMGGMHRKLEYMSMQPAREEPCRRCRILPICQGGCAYWRILKDDVCHDMKDCIEGLVADYARALQREGA